MTTLFFGLSDIDWNHFALYGGVIAGIVLIFMVVVFFLGFRKK